MANHSSTLAGKSHGQTWPQSMGSQRVGHNLATKQKTFLQLIWAIPSCSLGAPQVCTQHLWLTINDNQIESDFALLKNEPFIKSSPSVHFWHSWFLYRASHLSISLYHPLKKPWRSPLPILVNLKILLISRHPHTFLLLPGLYVICSNF